MKDLIEHMISRLRKRVGENLQRVRMSENYLQSLMSKPDSPEKEKEVNERFKYNKELLDENSDSINLQLSLIRYLAKYKEQLKNENSSGLSFSNKGLDFDDDDDDDTFVEEMGFNDVDMDECLRRTISGELDYDIDNPFFLDDEFQERLIEHYASVEDYEMCKMIRDIGIPPMD